MVYPLLHSQNSPYGGLAQVISGLAISIFGDLVQHVGLEFVFGDFPSFFFFPSRIWARDWQGNRIRSPDLLIASKLN